MKVFLSILAAISSAFLTTPAFAGCPDLFKVLDSDGDGSLDREEFYAAIPIHPFEYYDRNGDNYIDLPEFMIDCV